MCNQILKDYFLNLDTFMSMYGLALGQDQCPSMWYVENNEQKVPSWYMFKVCICECFLANVPHNPFWGFDVNVVTEKQESEAKTVYCITGTCEVHTFSSQFKFNRISAFNITIHNCLSRYHTPLRPMYKIGYKQVTELEWRCCPGYQGHDCTELKVTPEKPTVFEKPRPDAPSANSQQQSILGRYFELLWIWKK